MMEMTYDQSVDALYIRISGNEPVARSEQLDAGTLVDLDRFGRVLGIEVLTPARDWPLDQVVSKFSLDPDSAARLNVIFGSNAPMKTFPFTKADAPLASTSS